MPIENREITFSNPELKSAISDFLRRRDGDGTTELLKIAVVDDQAEPVSATIYLAKTDERVVQSLTSAEVGAAVMGYCRAQKIMLSRTAQKSLISKDGHIVLKLRLVSGQSAESARLSSLGT